MKIDSLYIKDYGIIDEIRIVPGRVNVLAGDNGNGKSTISQAIRYLFTNETVGSLRDNVRWGKSKFIIECEFSHLGKTYFYRVEGGSSTSKLLTVDDLRFENSEATKYLATIFNPKLMDYSNFALQDENTTILFEKPTERLNNIKALLNMEAITKAVTKLKELVKSEKSEYEKLEAKKNSMASFEFTLQNEPEEVMFVPSDELELNELIDKKKKYEEYLINRDKVSNHSKNLELVKSKIDSLTKELSEIVIEEISFDTRAFSVKEREIKTLESNIEDVKRKQLSRDSFEQKLKFLFENKSEYDSKLQLEKSELEKYPMEEDVLLSMREDFSQVQFKLSSLKEDVKLAENGKCPTCKQDFCIDKEEYEKEIKDLSAKFDSLKQSIDLYKKGLDSKNSHIKNIDRISQDIKNTIDKINSVEKEIFSLGEIESYLELEEQLNERSIAFGSLKKQKEEYNKKLAVNEELQKRKDKFSLELKTLETELNKLESLKIEILESVEWLEEDNLTYLSLQSKKADREKYESLLNSVIEFNKSIMEKKKKHDEEIENISKQMQDLDFSIGVKNESVKVLDKKFSTYLIGKGTAIIQDKMNEYFSRSYGRYSIAIKGDGNSVDFTYSNGEITAPVIRASGQERDVFGIAFRVALNMLQSTNFFLGDEIDDSASPENSVKMLSNLLSEGYEQVWLVSHKESTRDVLTNDFDAEVFYIKNGNLV